MVGLAATGLRGRFRSLAPLAAFAASAACADRGPGPGGAIESEADPAPLRAGVPRLTLGSWAADEHTAFYGVRGAVADRRAGILIVANGGDATLRTFGLDGAWRDTRGGVGGGPRELGALTALFDYRGDSVLVFDDARDEASVWPYTEGEVRRVGVPDLPEGDLRVPRLYGALGDGRLVWTADKRYREPDEVGASHQDTLVIFLTSPVGDGFNPVAETLGTRYFRYAASVYQQGRAPFPPSPFVLPGDSVIVFGSTEQPRAQRVFAAGGSLAPITFGIAPLPVTHAHRAWEIADRRRRLTSRPLPPSLLEGQRAVLDILPFRDAFPALGAVLRGDDGRVWARAYRPPVTDADGASRDEPGPSVWRVVAGPGDRGRAVAFPAGFDLLWADGEEAVGIVRDDFDVEQVAVFPLPGAARGRAAQGRAAPERVP